MNTPAAQAGNADTQLLSLLQTVERLSAERRDGDAERALQQAEALAPGHPLVLHERARRLLTSGDPHGARVLLERAVSAAPRYVPFRLTLAATLKALGRLPEQLAALDSALAVEPTHLLALLQKGATLDSMRQPRAAAAVYVSALQTLAPDARLPPVVAAHVEHARRRAAENAAELGGVLDQRLLALRGAHTDEERQRFERSLEQILGRRRIYAPAPTFMLFPWLSDYEFHPRQQFPWLAGLEAATADIQEELRAVLQEDGDGVQPYIDYEAGVPLGKSAELNKSRRWGAYFLINEGRRVAEHIARCPRTMAAVEALPLVDVTAHGPTVFFSILEPKTRIPPHTGVTNTRLTVHLPLIVPPGCGFRVGGETREWLPGTAWVFNDTIEHEAWNDSDSPRGILICDIWNPQLTRLERDLVRESTVAIGEYYRSASAAQADPP